VHLEERVRIAADEPFGQWRGLREERPVPEETPEVPAGQA
jgi:hypothetical protein